MIGDDVFHHLKPEQRNLRQHLAFLRDPASEDEVKSRNTIRGNNQELIFDRINVPDFAASEQRKSRQCCFQLNRRSAHESIFGKAELSGKNAGIEGSKLRFFERVEATCGSLLSEASRHCSPKAPHVKKLEKRCWNRQSCLKIGDPSGFPATIEMRTRNALAGQLHRSLIGTALKQSSKRPLLAWSRRTKCRQLPWSVCCA